MKRNEAEKLVNETLTQPYEDGKFRYFVSNLFKDYEPLNEQSIQGQYIFEAFRENIVSYKRIAKFKDPENLELDVLAVKVKNKRMLDNARTTQRNFVARYLTRKERDAALVAFYSDDSEDWRFSLVRMDYAYDEQKKKLVKELTPSRRYSFLVGKNEKSYTARKQLVPILENEFETTIQSIENAFNIEKVTKEFFEQYKELFLRLTEQLEKVRKENTQIDHHLHLLSIQTPDFCKKLLGQIVFLYFLQKKGWLGVDKDKKWGDGDKNFLRSLFEKCNSKGEKYFDHYLEPLFYEALATDDRDGDYYSRFDCRIPFLNGGLFEPTNGYSWQQYDFNIPNELFSNSYKTKSGDTGDGILDVFDRYNFTVREDESLEKEVAVDPEMLGKVFENLLEVKDRKSKGAFYTPREIVHYMCQESLINYLDTKLNIQRKPVETKKQAHLLPELMETDLLTEYEEIYNPVVPKDDIHYFIHYGDSARENDSVAQEKLKNNENYSGKTYKPKIPESIRDNAKEIDKALADVKICDPAIGSGAFPVGIMHEIVRARLTLLEADLVKKTKKANAYEYKRQAIQQSIYGVDIEESAIEIAKLRLWLSLVVDETDMEEIKPLPNLKYKIVKGNSLIGIDKEYLFNNPILKRLEELKDLYFDETSKGNKKKYEKEISEIIKSFAKDGQFDFEIFFSEVFRNNDGFDIVIGNPPYVGEKGNKELFSQIRKGVLSKFYQAKVDLYYLFFHLGLNLSKNHGILSYITTNYYTNATGAKNLRKDIKDRSSVLKLINFNELRIFESALGQHNLITILQKGKTQNIESEISVCSRTGFAGSDVLNNILHKQDDETAYENKRQENIFEGHEYYIRMLSGKNGILDQVLKKISAGNKILDEICNVNQGLRTGIDKVTNKHIKDYGYKGSINEGVFVINKKELDSLGLDSNQIVKPWFKNSDVSKYKSSLSSDSFLIYSKKDITEEYLSNNYPEIYSHLKKFKELIAKIRERNNEDLSQWHNLDRPRNERIFLSPKIIAPQRSFKNTFGYNEIPWYSSADVYYITQKDSGYNLKYILALLNSKLYYFWLYHKGKRKGEMLELYQKPLSEIPIKYIPELQQNKFVELADKIISKVNASGVEEKQKNIELEEIQNQIDKLVYELYELTPEEITIVEEAVK